MLVTTSWCSFWCITGGWHCKLYRSTLKHCCYTSHRNTKIYLSFSFVLNLWSHWFKFILFSVLLGLCSCTVVPFSFFFWLCLLRVWWILRLNPVPIPLLLYQNSACPPSEHLLIFSVLFFFCRSRAISFSLSLTDTCILSCFCWLPFPYSPEHTATSLFHLLPTLTRGHNVACKHHSP